MDLYVIAPHGVTDATLSAASMAEDSTAAWSAATAYVVGNRVHRTTTHTVYECRSAHTNQDPADEANVYDPDTTPTGEWITVGATNRWKPFDGKISDLATGTSDLSWEIAPTSTVSAIAVLNVSAGSVRVLVEEGATVLFDEERAMVDNSGVVDAWTYVYAPIAYETEAVFQAVPGYPGAVITIEIKGGAGSTRSVGEIVLGYEERVARVLNGASTGITDYSRKEFDDFGNPVIVERVYADTTTYPLVFDTTATRRLKRTLANLRATPAVYHVGEDANDFGLTVYGFPRDWPFSLESGLYTYLNLEVEGLT